MQSLSRWFFSVLVAALLVAGFLVPVAHADSGDEAPLVRPSIQHYQQARSNFARSNFARSNFGALREETSDTFGLADSLSEAVVQGAIDGDAYLCGPTGFDTYVNQLLAGLTQPELEFLLNSGALEFPAMEALVFGSGADDTFAGRDRRQALIKTFRDLQKFAPTTQNPDLVPMGGAMLRDAGRISRLLVALYGIPQAEADEYANAVAGVVQDVPAFAGGDSPLFTLNAFSFSGEGDPDPFIAGLPAKVVVGEGFLDALTVMGVGDIGAPVVLAHEYAHQLQVEHHLFDSTLTGPEATRRVELMADAYASYFAVHPRGLSLNEKRVGQVQQTFFELGDCMFGDVGHHGTPNQGRRASTWAAGLADAARPQGHVLPAQTFATLFDAELPTIVQPDA
jgi:hypothetical protein